MDGNEQKISRRKHSVWLPSVEMGESRGKAFLNGQSVKNGRGIKIPRACGFRAMRPMMRMLPTKLGQGGQNGGRLVESFAINGCSWSWRENCIGQAWGQHCCMSSRGVHLSMSQKQRMQGSGNGMLRFMNGVTRKLEFGGVRWEGEGELRGGR